MNQDFHNYPTAGEIPAIRPTTGPLTQSPYSVVSPVTPMPIPITGQLNPPLAHVGRPPTDQLLSPARLSPVQKEIMKASSDIFTILDLGCKCEKCRNGVMVILSDLISEVLTDTTITTLSINKLQRSIDNLSERIIHFMEAGGK